MSAIPDSDNVRSDSLVKRYLQVRQRSLDLCSPLKPDDYQVQPMDDASPPKWHLAHTTWFFETFLLKHQPGYTVFHPAFEMLFNSYYNGVGEQYPRVKRGHLSRPVLEEVLAYRHHVDAHMQRLLERLLDPETVFAVELGLNHEQQHQELIVTDLKYNLGNNPLKPAYHPPGRQFPDTPDQRAPACRMFEYEGGLTQLGTDGADGFCFDNETPRHEVYLQPFELASRPVTNGEFIEFIEDNGYHRPELWLSDGWAHLNRPGAERWEMPLYWRRQGQEYYQYALHGEEPVNKEAPVCHVSLYEADAFARWQGARLPREAEWELAAAELPIAGNFADAGRLHPVITPSNEREPAGMFGDVWEWTQSSYGPYPGFRPFTGQLGEYNGKFMSNQLVLKGGSCATPRSHIRRSYRNFFYPPDRWQFSGFRLARDLP